MSTSHWKTVRLSDIAEVRLGRQRSPKRANGPNMRPYMRAANVTWDGISLHDVKEMDFTDAEFETYALRDGDLLLAEASGSASEVGKPAVWTGQVSECCFQNTLIRVRAHDDLVPFLHLHFKKDAATGAFARASRGVGIHHLGAKAMCDWSVQVPPLGEQRRIVEAIDSYLTRLDDAVADLERAQRNLKRYRASVLKAAVEGRLVPTEAELAREEGTDYEPASVLLERILVERRRRWEEASLAKMQAKGKAPKDDRWKAKYPEPEPIHTSALPDLPRGWVWTSVDTIGEVLLGRQRAPQFLTGRFPRPYLRVANIKDDRIDYSDVEEMDFDSTHFEKYSLAPGDILVSEGQSPDRLGQSAIYGGGVDGLCFQKTLHRFRPIPSGPSSAFAQLVFRSHVKSGVFKKLGSITTNIAHLTLIKFKGSPFPLPPLNEQKRITCETERILSIIDELASSTVAHIVRCARLRQSLLRWAFEGRLVDQDPTDEPASRLLERIQTARDSANGHPRQSSRRPRARSPKA